MPPTEEQINKWELEEEIINKEEAPEFFENGKLIDEYRFDDIEKKKEEDFSPTKAGADFAFALIQIGKKDLTEEEKESIPY